MYTQQYAGWQCGECKYAHCRTYRHRFICSWFSIAFFVVYRLTRIIPATTTQRRQPANEVIAIESQEQIIAILWRHRFHVCVCLCVRLFRTRTPNALCLFGHEKFSGNRRIEI